MTTDRDDTSIEGDDVLLECLGNGEDNPNAEEASDGSAGLVGDLTAVTAGDDGSDGSCRRGSVGLSVGCLAGSSFSAEGSSGVVVVVG